MLDEKAKTREKCYILVDTGLAFFKNTIVGGIAASKKFFLRVLGLAAHGVPLNYIQQLILTHMDVDTAGNLNLFPDAEILTGNKRVNRHHFYVQKTAPSFVRLMAATASSK